VLLRNTSLLAEPADAARMFQPETGVWVKSRVEYIIHKQMIGHWLSERTFAHSIRPASLHQDQQTTALQTRLGLTRGMAKNVSRFRPIGIPSCGHFSDDASSWPQSMRFGHAGLIVSAQKAKYRSIVSSWSGSLRRGALGTIVPGVLAPALAIPIVFPRQIASAELTCCSGCGAESLCHWSGSRRPGWPLQLKQFSMPFPTFRGPIACEGAVPFISYLCIRRWGDIGRLICRTMHL
jgi:hypothetical protein